MGVHVWTVFGGGVCLVSADLHRFHRRLALRQTFLLGRVSHKFLPLQTGHLLLGSRGALLVFPLLSVAAVLVRGEEGGVLLMLLRGLLRCGIVFEGRWLLVVIGGGLGLLRGLDGEAEFVDVARVVVFFVFGGFADRVAPGSVLALLLGEDHVEVLHGVSASCHAIIFALFTFIWWIRSQAREWQSLLRTTSARRLRRLFLLRGLRLVGARGSHTWRGVGALESRYLGEQGLASRRRRLLIFLLQLHLLEQVAVRMGILCRLAVRRSCCRVVDPIHGQTVNHHLLLRLNLADRAEAGVDGSAVDERVPVRLEEGGFRRCVGKTHPCHDWGARDERIDGVYHAPLLLVELSELGGVDTGPVLVILVEPAVLQGLAGRDALVGVLLEELLDKVLRGLRDVLPLTITELVLASHVLV